jgi:hypothetical protein
MKNSIFIIHGNIGQPFHFEKISDNYTNNYSTYVSTDYPATVSWGRIRNG